LNGGNGAIQPAGLTVGARIGIVAGILLIAALLLIIIILKLKFFPREPRVKIDSQSSMEGSKLLIGDNRTENPPIEIIHSSGFPGATKIDRNSQDELYRGMEELFQEPPTGRVPGRVTLQNNPTSESGSTGRSAQDDGYGTESGSNQKVSTDSSHSESNSDYEVHVASLISSSAVPSSDRSSKICVIWDDATAQSYQPHQMRNKTQMIQTRMNRTRSVSHV